jgi:DNA-directed RNA polymerase subunit M/transcription elongation factor TFIIS
MFNSNKLDYIAKLVGLEGKMEHEGMPMWDDIVLYAAFKKGSRKAYDKSLATMIDYCEQDVVLTEEVYNKLRNYTEHQVHHGVLNGGNKFECPNCGSDKVKLIKTIVTKMGTIKRLMKCKKCGTQYYISNTEYLRSL